MSVAGSNTKLVPLARGLADERTRRAVDQLEKLVQELAARVTACEARLKAGSL